MGRVDEQGEVLDGGLVTFSFLLALAYVQRLELCFLFRRFLGVARLENDGETREIQKKPTFPCAQQAIRPVLRIRLTSLLQSFSRSLIAAD